MRAVLLACFFLSGSSGLILESLWTRELRLVFGSTTLAISTVLAAFMGGLGLGSYLAGRYADRHQEPGARLRAGRGGHRPLRAGWSRSILGRTRRSTRWMYRVFGDRCAAAVDACASSARPALLLVPTTLMGATLPLLARHFVHAARGSCGARACASARSTRSTCSARSRARSSPASCSCRCFGVALDQRHRRVLQPDAGRGDRARAPPPARRRRGRAADAPTSAWTRPPSRRTWRPTALPPPPVIDARSRRAVLVGVRRLGRDRDDAAGAVDARAGGAARLVGLLVHADPAGVPDRPRRRARRVFARVEPAHAAPGPLAGGAAPRDRRRGRR